MTPSEMALKAHANRRKKMSKEEISKHYSWVAGHRGKKYKKCHPSCFRHFDTLPDCSCGARTHNEKLKKQVNG